MLCVDSRGDVYVAEVTNTRVQKFTARAVGDAVPEDVAFVALIDKTEQRYVVVRPKGFDPKRANTAVVALHGHGADRWQFVKQERGECKGTRDVAAARGFLLVSPDYRAKTSWMGPAAEADVLQILDELREKYGVRRVVVAGGSMGGTAALAFAALHPDRVAGCVSLNGTANLVEYENFAAAIAASYGGTRNERPEVYRSRSAELHADRLTMPLAMTTGGKDTVVPPDSCLRLAERLKQLDRPVTLIHRPDGGHATTYDDTVKALTAVIDRLPKAGAGPAR
ncbi:alpha/beta fold hydrolase [bacterium]|nr:alpha/beta fold hydrolase [bacterium]